MRRLLSCWGLIMGLLLMASPLFAHETRPAYLEIKETAPNTFSLLFKVPAKGPEMRMAIHVLLPEDCQSVAPMQTNYTRGAYFDRTTFSHPNRLANAQITIEGLPKTVIDVLARVEYLDGVSQTTRLTPDDPVLTVEAAPTSFSVAKTYLILGVEHIWLGIDHLLFVLCLLLVTRTRKKLLITITGFTLAHSVTLALAALDVVKLPIPPVEAVIALSIVFLAYELIRNKEDSLTFRYPVAVSASFGLLHGFGFAAVLGEIGLPPAEIPSALLFFNVGVEVGQILFVLLLVGIYGLIRWMGKRLKTGTASTEPGQVLPPKLRLGLIYMIGAVASFWMIERIVGFWG